MSDFLAATAQPSPLPASSDTGTPFAQGNPEAEQPAVAEMEAQPHQSRDPPASDVVGQQDASAAAQGGPPSGGRAAVGARRELQFATAERSADAEAHSEGGAAACADGALAAEGAGEGEGDETPANAGAAPLEQTRPAVVACVPGWVLQGQRPQYAALYSDLYDALEDPWPTATPAGGGRVRLPPVRPS